MKFVQRTRAKAKRVDEGYDQPWPLTRTETVEVDLDAIDEALGD